MMQVLPIFARPFAWGAVDCCLAASDAFRAVHGVDPMRGIRGTYDSLRGALRVIRARGGFERMAQDQAAAAGLLPGLGAPGEIGLVAPEDVPLTGGGLAFCGAPGVWWMKSETGLVSVGRVAASWRV
ncbi:DUF6950 family protein [Mameliella alba]|uniref:DUF6950 family protein n=1 Tax=Mameliella alba TaxID=561184 RepID=UPI000B5386DC|nr:hypothetical protein [Mameliella alba]OWV44200.1 hypothetical protein CDZ95_05810 [Mameliella alba]BBU58493.1 hypothetical protein KU6B_47580 [Mameliella alba]